jgi:acetylglutamate kinase
MKTVTASLLVLFFSRATCAFVTPPRTAFATTTSHLVSAAQASDDAVPFADAALTIAGAASSLRGQTIVVKYGGNAMTSEELKGMFCQDVAALQNLGIRVVVGECRNCLV